MAVAGLYLAARAKFFAPLAERCPVIRMAGYVRSNNIPLYGMQLQTGMDKAWIVILALSLTVLIALQIQDSFACSCAPDPDFLMALTESEGAFQATVKDVLTGDGPRKIIFDIHQVQKGSYPHGEYVFEDSSVIYYWTGAIQDSSCKVDYKIGKTYQVFIYAEGQGASATNMCTTKQISGFYEGSHEDGEGQTQDYRQDYSFFGRYSMLLLSALIIILAIITGVVVWRKRKNNQR